MHIASYNLASQTWREKSPLTLIEATCRHITNLKIGSQDHCRRNSAQFLPVCPLSYPVKNHRPTH